MNDLIVEGPEDLTELKCPKCEKLLRWADDDQPSIWPMDLIAEADCCGVAYTACIDRIVIYTRNTEGN